MKQSPGRKEARKNARAIIKRNGDLNRRSTHKMRTHDGMVSCKKFKRTATGMEVA